MICAVAICRSLSHALKTKRLVDDLYKIVMNIKIAKKEVLFHSNFIDNYPCFSKKRVIF